jgi:hypothetical protein
MQNSEDPVLLLKIPMDTRKNFFKVYRHFGMRSREVRHPRARRTNGDNLYNVKLATSLNFRIKVWEYLEYKIGYTGIRAAELNFIRILESYRNGE